MKKAQAAMEFLMTYGWAILVVLIVIGALAYFGVLNPQNLMSERCVMPVDLQCEDHTLTVASGASLQLRNAKGTPITITALNVTGADREALGKECAVAGLSVDIASGVTADVTTGAVACSANLADLVGQGKKKFDIYVTWNYQGSSFVHKEQGELVTNVG